MSEITLGNKTCDVCGKELQTYLLYYGHLASYGHTPDGYSDIWWFTQPHDIYIFCSKECFVNLVFASYDSSPLGTIKGDQMCKICDDIEANHPTEDLIRFEWAETARPEGWWYYRKQDLSGTSTLLRNHKYKG